MSETKPNPSPPRTFNISAPIEACRLRREDLKRLYRSIHERQLEFRDTVLSQLAKVPPETPDQFQARRSRVTASFTTTVNITGGTTDEVVSGQGEQFFDSANIPDVIKTVYYTTVAGPTAIGITEQQLASRAILLLDFSRPTLLDFSKLPTLPTLNASKLTIFSSSESWFTALNTRVIQLISERRTGFDWLHKAGIYDLFLITIGLPFALWIAYRLSTFSFMGKLQVVIAGGVYVYAVILGLFIFRVLFSYSRWVFPMIELQSETSAPFRHRALWSGVMIAVLGAIIWDTIKSL